jgi:sugar-specific transcriptional regulator TrmB
MSDEVMHEPDVLAALSRFGFPDREARIYLAALRRGGGTARDLVRDSGIDRVLAYRALELLRAAGVVQTTAERPRRFLPVPPEAVLERRLQERRLAIDADLALSKRLLKVLPSPGSSPIAQAPRFQMVTGQAAVYRHLREMIQRTERSLWTMITPKALRESWNAGLSDDVARLLRNGREFWLIVEPDVAVGGLMRRLFRARKRYPAVRVRAIRPQRSRLAISDGREVMIFLVPEALPPGIEEVAVWTDAPEFVLSQAAYFQDTWQHALPFPRLRSEGGRPRT